MIKTIQMLQKSVKICQRFTYYSETYTGSFLWPTVYIIIMHNITVFVRSTAHLRAAITFNFQGQRSRSNMSAFI